jgi:hypothetical protein
MTSTIAKTIAVDMMEEWFIVSYGQAGDARGCRGA